MHFLEARSRLLAPTQATSSCFSCSLVTTPHCEGHRKVWLTHRTIPKDGEAGRRMTEFVGLGSLLEAMPLTTQPEGSAPELQLWFMGRESVNHRAMLTPRKEWRWWPSAGLLEGPSPWVKHRLADSTQPSPRYSQCHFKGEHLIYRCNVPGTA